uniref:C2H2-type domain-containing protein n=1 Tax=Scophthalmus maximus TaxID=52904 RepID=A0A8D2ZJ59_SCOMX
MDAFNKELTGETVPSRKRAGIDETESDDPTLSEADTGSVTKKSAVYKEIGLEDEIAYAVQRVESLERDKVEGEQVQVLVRTAEDSVHKCPKAFSYASALTLHDRTHTKEAPFLCWDCGKGCRSNAALRIHRLCCHSGAEEKRFCCEHCGKVYALKRSLDLHVAKLHTGVRYPCSHCGNLFRSANSLTRHYLTHTEERPYSCSECDKGFRSASELKIHTRYHTGERPFRCQECGKGFVQSYYLTAHRRMHTGEKPYKCPTCNRSFKSAGILKRHQITHTGEKPHKCSDCEMAFSLFFGLALCMSISLTSC